MGLAGRTVEKTRGNISLGALVRGIGADGEATEPGWTGCAGQAMMSGRGLAWGRFSQALLASHVTPDLQAKSVSQWLELGSSERSDHCAGPRPRVLCFANV
jgi:hypothetical protein